MRAMTLATTLALTIAVSVGCSSDPPSYTPRRGALKPGTARLTIGDNDSSATKSVQCASVAFTTTIRAGDENAGVTIQLRSAKKLTVEFVRIRTAHGFNGDYNLGLGEEAEAGLTDATYHVNGTASGFVPQSPVPKTESFVVEVAC